MFPANFAASASPLGYLMRSSQYISWRFLPKDSFCSVSIGDWRRDETFRRTDMFEATAPLQSLSGLEDAEAHLWGCSHTNRSVAPLFRIDHNTHTPCLRNHCG